MARTPDGAAKPARRAGKHDADVARLEVDLAKVKRSLEVWRIVANGFAVALWIAASSLPIWALQSVIEPLAGKTTVVNANIVISVTLTLSIVINGMQYVKGQSRKRGVKDLRDRAERLEKKILE